MQSTAWWGLCRSCSGWAVGWRLRYSLHGRLESTSHAVRTQVSQSGESSRPLHTHPCLRLHLRGRSRAAHPPTAAQAAATRRVRQARTEGPAQHHPDSASLRARHRHTGGKGRRVLAQLHGMVCSVGQYLDHSAQPAPWLPASKPAATHPPTAPPPPHTHNPPTAHAQSHAPRIASTSAFSFSSTPRK